MTVPFEPLTAVPHFYQELMLYNIFLRKSRFPPWLKKQEKAILEQINSVLI